VPKVRVSLASFRGGRRAGRRCPADAATIVVNSTRDTADGAPGDNTCDTGISGTTCICTLRAAVQSANFDSTPDVIMLPANTYTRTLTTTNEDAAANGDLDVTQPSRSRARAPPPRSRRRERRTACSTSRPPATSARERDRVGTGTSTRSWGGGILNAGTLSLDHVVLTATRRAEERRRQRRRDLQHRVDLRRRLDDLHEPRDRHVVGRRLRRRHLHNANSMSLNRTLVSGNTP